MPDGQGQGPKDPIYSDRVEDKYVFNLSDLNVVASSVEDYLDPNYVKKGTEYTLVSSTYLDTPDMSFLKQDFSDATTKYKLRIRSYGPNGKWDDDKYLEVKYKVGDVKKKARIKINTFGMLEVLGGQPVPENQRKINTDLPDSEYDEAVSLINKIAKDGVIPTVKVTYKRLSYKGGSIRCTLDHKLEVEAFAGIKNFKPSDELKAKIADIATKLEASSQGVIEIKYQIDKDTPEWMDSLVKKYKKSTLGFSKMLWGIYECL